jgi:hypothetical protein
MKGALRLPAATGAVSFWQVLKAGGRTFKTPVQQALMRGLATAFPEFRLGAASL